MRIRWLMETVNVKTMEWVSSSEDLLILHDYTNMINTILNYVFSNNFKCTGKLVKLEVLRKVFHNHFLQNNSVRKN